MPSTVCVVVVHHRGAALLDACLESLRASRGVAVDAVVVANDCREPLPASALAADVRLVRSERPLGFGEANNLGVRRHRDEARAQPDHYLFLNNDATVTEATLAQLAAHFEAHPGTGIVGPRVMVSGTRHLNSLGLNVTEFGEAWDEGIGVPLQEYGTLPPVRTVVGVSGCALVVRAKLFEHLGGWDPLYGFYFEDLDLCLRAWSLEQEVEVVTNAEAGHAVSATAARGSDFKLYHSWRNQLLLVAIHWPPAWLARVLPRLLVFELLLQARRLRARASRDARLQRSAWGGFLRMLPSALARRRRRGHCASWTRLLAPAGSVPTIELPQPTPPAVTPAAKAAPSAPRTP